MIGNEIDTGAASLLDAMPQLVCVADAGGSLTYVNERWTTYTGLPLDALWGSGWTAAIDPNSRADIVAAWLSDVARHVAVSEHRVRYQRADGVYGWFLWRATPVIGPSGSVTRWVGTLTDIDTPVRLEQIASASEERLRSIIETTQEGVWIVDAAANTRYVNQRFAELLGYTPDELFGMSAYHLFRESDRPMLAEKLASRRMGQSGTCEFCLTRSDGTELWTLTAASPIFDADGSFTGTLGMVTDITKRKAMEDQLAKAAHEYTLLAEVTPQIVWTAEPNGAFTYVNGRWTAYTGIAPNRARDWGWIPAVHADDVSALLVAWRKALESGTDLEVSLRLYQPASGTYRWHVMRACSQVDNTGLIVRWFGTLTDIHTERRTARQLEIIARTSTVLAESFDRDALLGRLADLICTEFAQYVIVVLQDQYRRLRVAATAHRDPTAAMALVDLHEKRLLLPQYEAELLANIAPGGILTGNRTTAQLIEVLLPEACSAIELAGAGEYVCVPLQTRGGSIGAILALAPAQGSFGEDERRILVEMATRGAVAVENAELYAREHRVSATLQQALLPARLPTIAGIEFDAIYEPGVTEAQIGGDWYDAVELADGRIIVSIGDVTGRGLTAAVIMGRVRQALEALATYQSDPAELLNAADVVLRRTHPDAIVTALVGLIDLNRRTFAYATAGHPTPIVRGADGSVVTLPGSGLPLGLRDAHQPPTTTIVLPSNSLLLLFTDGLVESTRDIEEGERRVEAALRNEAIVSSAHPAAAIKAAVLHDGSSDDVAVFTIRVGDLAERDQSERAESSVRRAWSMHWTFDARDARSTRDVRDLFIAYLRAKGSVDADYAAAEVVFGELLANVVQHAAGTVDIEVEWRGDAPVLHVLDRGPGYDRAEALPPQLSEGGRGLYLVATLTHEFTVTRLPGYGSHARAVLAIDRVG